MKSILHYSKILTIAFLLFNCKARSQNNSSKNSIEKNNDLTAILIDSLTVKKHLYTLASDEMQGRATGTEGIEKAAQYIEKEFKRIGLTHYDTLSSYRQNFEAQNMKMFNVIGVIEGKSKKDEYIIISAHYDHLGMKKQGTGDIIYNGADDDASGVSAVLSLAEYYKKVGNERTLVFIAFTAEELGLIGSTYFGKHINPEKYIAGINIEMIGKTSSYGPKTAWLTGFDRSNFGKIIQKNLENSNYKLYPDPYPKFNLFYRSDNASLAKLGVPAHTFSTGPIDKDKHYHKVSDEAQTLNISNITETIKAIALGTKSIINAIDTPTRVKTKD
ncbi:M28 family peptidase [Tenacibaculum agarivorans]|uniref:M28 family peptidase n=1 Tax=Tenacibaculum agarivorans TaxID=1908389 RepID=UPI0009FB027A|nr:M28 family peptidase [Tenacibaculum agarivorans]